MESERDRKIICLSFGCGKKHDFKLFRDSKLPLNENIKVITDTGYLGIKNEHPKSEHPKKKSKNGPLTKREKIRNRKISRRRVINEHMIGFLKRFRILAEKYRNRRKRFCLRFNLIAGICNFDLS
jgi:IS5 family transposase